MYEQPVNVVAILLAILGYAIGAAIFLAALHAVVRSAIVNAYREIELGKPRPPA